MATEPALAPAPASAPAPEERTETQPELKTEGEAMAVAESKAETERKGEGQGQGEEQASVDPTSSSSQPSSTEPKPASYSSQLKGHQGHLNAAQESALEQMKSKVEAEITLKQGERKWWNDTTLLRYLRARSFSPSAAFQQFQSTHHWRNSKNLDSLYANFSVSEFEEARKFYPRWNGRRDRLGKPIYVYKLSQVGGLMKELDGVEGERRWDRIICLTEVLDRFIFPLMSSLPSISSPTPISSVTTIIDLSSLSLRTLWRLKSHLQASISLNSSHSPETLSTIIILNAPYFMSTIWGYIRSWFDKGTVEKIVILSGNGTESKDGEILREIFHEKDLPRVYGGLMDWQYTDEPDLEEEIRRKINRETLPPGPLVWENEQLKLTGSGRE